MKKRLSKSLCVLCFALCTSFAVSSPQLPIGLGPAEESKTTDASPTLPTGLGLANPSGSPALPTGLDADNHNEKQAKSEDFASGLSGTTGFLEMRGGWRTRNDANEKDMSIGETRLQLEVEKSFDGFSFNLTTDLYYDLVMASQNVNLEEGDGFLDLREASVIFSPADFMDIKLGRQILTWGTGDMVFINDMFPKDWQSFFIGRDEEYLKAPSDAAKASIYTDWANIDFVYTPRFDSDRYISGERISYWNGNATVGNNDVLDVDKPEGWFGDDEFAIRISKNFSGYELAAYGYWGYWKSPSGVNTVTFDYLFNRLDVYGASVRGQVGRGIANVELGYYDSKDDADGDDFFTANSQMRYLVGYEQDVPEIAQDFTVALQFYVEQTINYDSYLASVPAGKDSSIDEYRQLLTLRLTKLLYNQNVTASLFTYFSPTDKDVYMRPNLHYKVSDNLGIEVGANVFWGDYPHTFFGQFADNTNVYAAIRYSF